ncbi:MafI family immunity protein [Streptomyces polygonati]|uniref:MafI family immunity protein n=1 Tax=Streptomyces polygonati TaxID=1617087 RepID=A0ABV8HZ83_9ACTN
MIEQHSHDVGLPPAQTAGRRHILTIHISMPTVGTARQHSGEHHVKRRKSDTSPARLREITQAVRSRNLQAEGPEIALQTVIELAENDEMEMAFEWLCGIIRSHDLTISRTEFTLLSKLGKEWDIADLVEEIRDKVDDESGTAEGPTVR